MKQQHPPKPLLQYPRKPVTIQYPRARPLSPFRSHLRHRMPRRVSSIMTQRRRQMRSLQKQIRARALCLGPFGNRRPTSRRWVKHHHRHSRTSLPKPRRRLLIVDQRQVPLKHIRPHQHWRYLRRHSWLILVRAPKRPHQPLGPRVPRRQPILLTM